MAQRKKMRHVDEYRDPASVQTVSRQIHETAKRPWTLMEVCGGQTHSILKFGLDQLLPSQWGLFPFWYTFPGEG